jgi:hypothetical protein
VRILVGEDAAGTRKVLKKAVEGFAHYALLTVLLDVLQMR